MMSSVFGRGETQQVGDYQLAGKLGKGASGVVFKAIHRLYGNMVAIKKVSTEGFSKDEVSNFEIEIKLLKELDHPNIIKYIDSTMARDALYIVLEYAEGGSLAKMMRQIEPGYLPRAPSSVGPPLSPPPPLLLTRARAVFGFRSVARRDLHASDLERPCVPAR